MLRAKLPIANSLKKKDPHGGKLPSVDTDESSQQVCAILFHLSSLPVRPLYLCTQLYARLTLFRLRLGNILAFPDDTWYEVGNTVGSIFPTSSPKDQSVCHYWREFKSSIVRFFQVV